MNPKVSEQKETVIKIHLRQINDRGMDIAEKLPAEWVGLNEKDQLYFTEPVSVEANITRADDELIVAVKARSQYASCCYRCLESLNQEWEKQFNIILDIDEQTEFLEIDEDIRQEIILNTPTRVLCRKDCKGLCVDCGANLNAETCAHVHRVASSKI